MSLEFKILAPGPRNLHQEPRQIPTYMTAIIRRHRFTIIIVTCFSLLLILNWQYGRNEKIARKITQHFHVDENNNEDTQILNPTRQQFSDVNKLSHRKQSQIITPERPLETEIEQFKFQDEEFNKFIPVEETNKLVGVDVEQFEPKFAPKIGEEEEPLMPALGDVEKEIFLPIYNGMVEETKHVYLEKSAFGVTREKPVTFSNPADLEYLNVTLSNQVHSKEEFPLHHEGFEWAKDPVTLSFTRNKTQDSEVVRSDPHYASPNILDETKTGENPVLLIDTPGCKIPRLDPWDPTVKDLIELQDPYICPGPPIFMRPNPGGSISLNKTILENYYNITPEELKCYYQSIKRFPEPKGTEKREVFFELGDGIRLQFDVPLNIDHAKIICNMTQSEYEEYLPLVRLKEDVEEERNSIISPNPALNVILIGIDSVSKLNFLRHFPRTHKFLNEKLKPFEMNGYTKVGDNTFPNIIALLTGQFVEHWWNETLKDDMFFDDIGLIWKEYAKRGYRTFYAEDNPLIGIFSYLKRGFYNPPTDYYFRPLALALETWIFRTQPKQFCLNSKIDFEIIYDYLKDFAQTMGKRPHFGFAMLSTITHDKLNNAGFVDEPTVHLLESLLDVGALNNTILVLFSDHGLRYGRIRHTYVGKYEERLPLMYIHVPEWFLDQNPEIRRNLIANQDRLMTLFDVHATMLHVLDLSKTSKERSMASLGTSLFEEITPNRTCQDAYIETHFCPCQTFDIVDLNSPEAKNASQALVDDINSKLEPYGDDCEVLELDKILDARVGKATEIMLQYLAAENEVINRTIYFEDGVTSLDDYMITFVTKPGEAVFEGTVRHDTYDNSYRVLGVSRINMYGNTSWCIDSLRMKLFCYCKFQKD